VFLSGRQGNGLRTGDSVGARDRDCSAHGTPHSCGRQLACRGKAPLAQYQRTHTQSNAGGVRDTDNLLFARGDHLTAVMADASIRKRRMGRAHFIDGLQQQLLEVRILVLTRQREASKRVQQMRADH
jgi:hypothetical protein